MFVLKIGSCFETTSILPTVNVGIQCTNLHRHIPEIPSTCIVNVSKHNLC